MVKVINNVKLLSKQVKVIKCNNTGENLKMIKYLKDNDTYQGRFQLSAPGTPRSNGLVERAFAFLYDRVRAMLNQSGLEGSMCSDLWEEAANLAVDLDNMITRNDGKTSEEKMLGQRRLIGDKLLAFGEMVIVKNKSRTKKLQNKGEVRCT